MQVGDAFVGVHHGHVWTRLHGLLQGRLNCRTVMWRHVRKFGDQIAQPIVEVHPSFFQGLCVLGDNLLEEDADRSPKKNGVGHLHHGGLHVQREQGAFLLDDVQFVLEKGLHRGERQARSIEDFTCLQGQTLLEHVTLSIGCHVHHIDGGRLRQGDALLGSKEVAMAHAGHSGLAVALPCAHAMRVLLGIRLHGFGCTTVAVAFTQHRIDS